VEFFSLESVFPLLSLLLLSILPLNSRLLAGVSFSVCNKNSIPQESSPSPPPNKKTKKKKKQRKRSKRREKTPRKQNQVKKDKATSPQALSPSPLLLDLLDHFSQKTIENQEKNGYINPRNCYKYFPTFLYQNQYNSNCAVYSVLALVL